MLERVGKSTRKPLHIPEGTGMKHRKRPALRKACSHVSALYSAEGVLSPGETLSSVGLGSTSRACVEGLVHV